MKSEAAERKNVIKFGGPTHSLYDAFVQEIVRRLTHGRCLGGVGVQLLCKYGGLIAVLRDRDLIQS